MNIDTPISSPSKLDEPLTRDDNKIRSVCMPETPIKAKNENEQEDDIRKLLSRSAEPKLDIRDQIETSPYKTKQLFLNKQSTESITKP